MEICFAQPEYLTESPQSGLESNHSEDHDDGGDCSELDGARKRKRPEEVELGNSQPHSPASPMILKLPTVDDVDYGLFSWPSALALAAFVFAHRDLFKGDLGGCLRDDLNDLIGNLLSAHARQAGMYLSWVQVMGFPD